MHDAPIPGRPCCTAISPGAPAFLCLVYDGRLRRFASAKRSVGRQQLGVNWATGAALWTTLGQPALWRKGRAGGACDPEGAEIQAAVRQRSNNGTPVRRMNTTRTAPVTTPPICAHQA